MIKKKGHGKFEFTEARIDIAVPAGYDRRNLDELIEYATDKVKGKIKINIIEFKSW